MSKTDESAKEKISQGKPVRITQGRQKNINAVKALMEKLEKSQTIVLTDYQGLSHKQLEELRKALKSSEAEYSITKNSLLKRALTESERKLPEEHFSGTTATLFAYADAANPIKAITKFFKDNEKGAVKTGLMNNTILSVDDIEKIAKLPSREMLLAKLAGQLNAPLSGLHNALSWNIRKLAWTLEAIRSNKN